MKKLIILTTSFVFLILFVVPFAASLFIKIVPDNDQPPYDINNKRGIYGVNGISQEFTAQSNNLTAVGLSVGNPNLKNKNEVIFTLYGDTGGAVRQVKLSGANIPDGDLLRIVFDPISDSKGKNYLFTIYSSSAGPEEILNVFFSTQKTTWIGPARYGKEVIENGMPIVTYYKVSSRFQLAGDIFTSWVKRIF